MRKYKIINLESKIKKYKIRKKDLIKMLKSKLLEEVEKYNDTPDFDYDRREYLDGSITAISDVLTLLGNAHFMEVYNG